MKQTTIAIALSLSFAAANAAAFDANTASRSELESVRGIGPITAERIEQARPFTGCADMEARVRGIGPKKREAWEAAGHTCGAGKHDAD